MGVNTFIFEALFAVVPILVVVIFAFAIAMIVSPKLRGKMMARQIKAQKQMIEESKDDLIDISTTTAGIGIASNKEVLDQNAEVLKDIELRKAEIEASGIEVKARAVKKGFGSVGSIYCKYCGAVIDNDSTFCKYCGREQ